MANEDIIISVRMELENANTAIKSIRRNLTDLTGGAEQLAMAQQKAVKVRKDLNNLMSSPLGLPKNFASSFIDVNKDLKSLSTVATQTIPDIKKQFASAGKLVDQQFTTAIANSKFQFQGWAMSIMFAGMMIKQAMNTIWQSSSKTFNDVMHSVEGNVTSFDKLQGSLIYLGFTVGEALAPIAEWLVPIVDAVAEWVSQNPGLTATAFIFTTLASSLAFIGGSLVLASSGFAELAVKLGLASVNAQGLFKMDWAALGSKITSGIGLISIAWGVHQAQDAFASFKEGKWVDSLLQAASSGLMTTGGIMMLRGGTAAGGALFALGIAFELLDSNTFFQTIGSFMKWIIAAFATMMMRIKWSWVNGWKGMMADAISVILDNSIIGIILSLAGYDVGAAVTKALAPDRGTFDWKGTFSKFIQESAQDFKNLDTQFAEFKNEIQGTAVPTAGTAQLGPEAPASIIQYNIDQVSINSSANIPESAWNQALRTLNASSGG